MNRIDLASGWSKLWAAISNGNDKLIGVLTIFGVALVVSSLVVYIWERRRGSGGNHKSVWGMLLVGAIMVAPTLVFPLLLMILDSVANAAVNLFNV